MSFKLSAKLLATALAFSAGPLLLVQDATPASAQVSVSVSFGYFHTALSPYGHWFHHARWGDVWIPAETGFRPYYRRGHWVYTDAGWMWVSDYRFGNIVFHYGRWVYDPGSGWLWVPGYVWGPSWVIWRQGNGYIGWCPMPPDDAWLAGEELWPAAWSDADRAYGYLDWYGPAYGPQWLAASAWAFVPTGRFADSNVAGFAADPRQAENILGRTRDVTSYGVVNDRVVNRSIDPAMVGRAMGRQITQVSAHNALRGNTPMDPVSTGRQIQAGEMTRHGGDPHAPANARAVPLNAAAAQRGGRAVFGTRQQAAAGPARNAGATREMTRAGNAAHGAATHGPVRVASTHQGRSFAAAPHGGFAGRTHEAHFAGHASFAPRAQAAHMAPASRGPNFAAHFAPRAERGPARGPTMAFGGGGPRGGFGGGPPMGFGGPHGGGGGGPRMAFGGGGGPHGGGGGPPAAMGGGGGPHGGGGGPPGGGGGPGGGGRHGHG